MYAMLAVKRSRHAFIARSVEVLGMKKPAWLTRKVLIRGSAALAMVGAAITLIYGIKVGNVKAGFGPDETVTKSEKKDRQGYVIETTTTTTPQDGKTLWDWLSLLGVPVSLAILGYLLQQLQQARADQQVKVEKEIAASNQREEALQNYLDRLSELLIDKNLIAMAVKRQANTENQAEDNPPHPTTLEEKELLNAARDVIRARTLSILRRLGKDGERKGDVIRFLVEAEVISKLKLNLDEANLNSAHLVEANLSGAKLNSANLCGAKLNSANLGNANLCGAKLNSANLRDAKLFRAYLSNANLDGANLDGANLCGADLFRANLCGANLGSANLCGANLGSAGLIGANLSFANLSFAHLSAAYLRDANLRDANLSDVNLRDVKDWTEEQLAAARL